jgi:hypothetical protein
MIEIRFALTDHILKEWSLDQAILLGNGRRRIIRNDCPHQPETLEINLNIRLRRFLVDHRPGSWPDSTCVRYSGRSGV